MIHIYIYYSYGYLVDVVVFIVGLLMNGHEN